MLYAPAPHAQQKAMCVVGYLNISPAPSSPVNLSHDLVHEVLSETGYFEGQNMASEYRWAGFHYDRLPALAADLVSRKVDVIIALGGHPYSNSGEKRELHDPDCFRQCRDPVGVDLVASLARPGGNLTGFSNVAIALTAKQLELLSELLPQAGVIALLVNPNNANAEGVIRYAQEAAHAPKVQLAVQKGGTEAKIDAALASLGELHAVVSSSTMTGSSRAGSSKL